jgi:hypothetical protein
MTSGQYRDVDCDILPTCEMRRLQRNHLRNCCKAHSAPTNPRTTARRHTLQLNWSSDTSIERTSINHAMPGTAACTNSPLFGTGTSIGLNFQTCSIASMRGVIRYVMAVSFQFGVFGPNHNYFAVATKITVKGGCPLEGSDIALSSPLLRQSNSLLITKF